MRSRRMISSAPRGMGQPFPQAGKEFSLVHWFTNNTCRSPTLVSVRPVRSVSPSGPKKWKESLRASTSAVGGRPRAAARRSVSASTQRAGDVGHAVDAVGADARRNGVGYRRASARQGPARTRGSGRRGRCPSRARWSRPRRSRTPGRAVASRQGQRRRQPARRDLARLAGHRASRITTLVSEGLARAAAAAATASAARPTTKPSARASRASPGLGVSASGPRARPRRAARTAAGMHVHRRRARRARRPRPCQVDASGQPGPRADHAEVVADDVRQRQRRGGARGRRPPASRPSRARGACAGRSAGGCRPRPA